MLQTLSCHIYPGVDFSGGQNTIWHRVSVHRFFFYYSPYIKKNCLRSNMAPQGRELAIEEKDIIVKLSEEGFSCYKIQETTGINCRTIQKFFKWMRERQNVANLSQSWWEERWQFVLMCVWIQGVKTNQRQTLKDITARLNARTGCDVSPRTVSRRLFKKDT